MDTESSGEKLYRRLLGLCSICAFAATGIISIGAILLRPPFNPAKPSLQGVLCSGLMGLGFLFGSFYMYAQGKSKGNSTLPAYGPHLILLLMGILELFFTGAIAYSNLKVPGY